MQLIGMLDSPYVRRVAVSLKLMGVPFEHQAVSVFRHYDRFKSINPVVKAPTLVCEDGTVLMDSTLILDHVESLAPAGRRLMPAGGTKRLEALRVAALALAACEKCVQIVYEKEQRPAEKRHAPWLGRVTGQANAALGTWRFSQYYNAIEIPAGRYPALVAHSQRAEALPEFASTPLD